VAGGGRDITGYLANLSGFCLRNLNLLVLPILTACFAWKRRLAFGILPWLAGAFIVIRSIFTIHYFI